MDIATLATYLSDIKTAADAVLTVVEAAIENPTLELVQKIFDESTSLTIAALKAWAAANNVTIDVTAFEAVLAQLKALPALDTPTSTE